MSLAKVWNFTIEQGASFYKELQWKRRNTQNEDWKPVDMGGYHVRCQIRYRANSNIVVKDLHTKIINSKEGKFAIWLSNRETATLPTTGETWQDYELMTYDIKTFAPGLRNAYRLVNGRVRVSPAVTKIDL